MRFLLILVFSLFFVALVSNYIYGGFNIHNLSNGFFAIGLPMFFGSLIILTGAKNVFISIGYTFKNMVRKQSMNYGNYYEHSKNKQEDKTSFFGLSTLIISLLYLVIAFYLGFQAIS